MLSRRAQGGPLIRLIDHHWRRIKGELDYISIGGVSLYKIISYLFRKGLLYSFFVMLSLLLHPERNPVQTTIALPFAIVMLDLSVWIIAKWPQNKLWQVLILTLASVCAGAIYSVILHGPPLMDVVIFTALMLLGSYLSGRSMVNSYNQLRRIIGG